MTVTTVSPVEVKQATRHVCINRSSLNGSHTRGPGTAKRRRCAFCGGVLHTETGTYGVFTWTGTGRYPLKNAIRTFAHERAADEFASSADSLVVRWVYTR